jgi:FkbM family methyltransferase
MSAPRLIPVFEEIIPTTPFIEVIDIGSNPSQHHIAPPCYESLRQRGRCRVTGFEPGKEAFAALNALTSDASRYFPYAVGDGTVQTFYECAYSVMSSLFEPNHELLQHFHVLDRAAQVRSTSLMETKRLDDIPEITGCDYLHIDVQGAELQCFQGGEKLLKNMLVIHTEANFLPMYKGQPLFSEVEIYLRQRGFMLHRINDLQTRVLKPLCLNSDAFAGWRQWFWGDAVFIRDIATWKDMSGDELLKMAAILHEIYHAFDLVQLILVVRDAKLKTKDNAAYLQMLVKHVPELVTAPNNIPA